MNYKPSKRFSAEQLDFAFVRKFMPGRYRRTTNETLMPANLVLQTQERRTLVRSMLPKEPYDAEALRKVPMRPSVVERNPRYWVECDCGGLDEGCACGGSNGRAGRRLVQNYK